MRAKTKFALVAGILCGLRYGCIPRLRVKIITPARVVAYIRTAYGLYNNFMGKCSCMSCEPDGPASPLADDYPAAVAGTPGVVYAV